jgi:uncharacterized surface protein with fasciclin (FAS1) repeats
MEEADPNATVVGIAGLEGELSILVAAAARAGFVDVLSDTESQLTIFAPVNSAFISLLGALGIPSLEDVPLDLLTAVLNYHVVSGEVLADADLVDGLEVETSLGVPFTVSNDGSTIEIIAPGSTAKVIAEDIFTTAGNVVIHVIDTVLVPIDPNPSEAPVEEPEEEGGIPDDSIAGVAIATPALSTLVEAVIAADLVGLFVDPTDAYTVLAPTNEAFGDLLAALGAGGLEDIPLELLTDVLAYHVIPSAAIFSTDLVDGAVVTTLGGAELTVDLTSVPGSVIFDGIGSDATVVIADVEAGNSVVHVIDTVLLPIPPPAPEPPSNCRPRGFGCRFAAQCCSGTCRRRFFSFFRTCAP